MTKLTQLVFWMWGMVLTVFVCQARIQMDPHPHPAKGISWVGNKVAE